MLPKTRLGKRSPFGALVNPAVPAAQTGQDPSDPGLSVPAGSSPPAPKVSHVTAATTARTDGHVTRASANHSLGCSLPLRCIFSAEEQVSLQVWRVSSCRGILLPGLHPIIPPPPPAADLSPPASMSPEGEPSSLRRRKSGGDASCRLTLKLFVLQSAHT